jgi:predicted DNA-binding protein (MmcQ/YjbR family)
MIVKIKSYKRIGAVRGLLEYALNEKKRLFDKSGRSFVVTNNLKGQTINEWVNEFKWNEKCRKHKRKNNIFLTQEIISFHREDSKNITLKKMQDMAREYMRLRNPNSVFVASPHFDKSHWHIHIIVASVEYRSGKSLRMSRRELADLKKGIQNYQIEKYPELSKSIVKHGRKRKSKITDKEYQYKQRTGKQTKREELFSIISDCHKNSKTQEDFLTRLKTTGLQTYIRGGRIYGVIYEDKKYRFKTLGIDIENFQSKEIRRGKEMNVARKKKEKKRGRNI